MYSIKILRGIEFVRSFLIIYNLDHGNIAQILKCSQLQTAPLIHHTQSTNASTHKNWLLSPGNDRHSAWNLPKNAHEVCFGVIVEVKGEEEKNDEGKSSFYCDFSRTTASTFNNIYS